MKEYRIECQPGSVPAAVAQIPFFLEVAEETLPIVLRHTRILDCEPGDVITEQGDEDQSLIFLLRGKVRVVRDGTVIGEASETGVLFGEVALLHGGVRSATLVADTQVYCLRVEQDFVGSLSESDRHAFEAAMYRFLAKLLAERLAITTEKLANPEPVFGIKPPTS